MPKAQVFPRTELLLYQIILTIKFLKMIKTKIKVRLVKPGISLPMAGVLGGEC